MKFYGVAVICQVSKEPDKDVWEQVPEEENNHMARSSGREEEVKAW